MSARLQAAPLVGHLLIDEAYDQTHASDGFSRYGAYLAMRLPAVADDDPDVLTDPVRWAAFAWATATTPVMSPAYVDWSDPIEDIQVGWDNGHLAIEAVLRSDPPVNLPGWRGWDRDRQGNHVEPWYGTRTSLTRITLRAMLVEFVLPSPPAEASSREDIVFTAKAAVGAVALAVEDVLAPVIVTLARRNDHIRAPRQPMSATRQPDGQEEGGVARLLTIEEVAEYLQVPVQTLYHWRYKRTGPKGVRVGRFVRYHCADVEAWLRMRRPSCESEETARRRRKAS